MECTMRQYHNEEDYWQIREFLRKIFLLQSRKEKSWHVARWDYWVWHGTKNISHDKLEKVVYIWETPAKKIAAVLNPEDKGHVHLQVHPEVRTLKLEEEMIVTAEKNLAITTPSGEKLVIWVNHKDFIRQKILKRRNYTKNGDPEHQRWQKLETPIPEPPIPSGYTVKSMGDGAELLERCYTSGLAFHPDDIKIAVENRNDISWYRNIQTAPLYRRDLDIVAVTPHGDVASFCTVWFDDVTRTAYFEPVGTAPVYQRRGLGKAVILEGLRRIKKMGALIAYVGGYSDPANALYRSAGFTQYSLSEPWVKEI
ncbi:MAG: GNAT family N-acetyltransferase [Candidatus Methanofastidiosia archaeon]